MPENDPLSRFDPPEQAAALPDGHAVVLRDYRLLAGMRHPVKVALWLALMRPSEELLARESLVESVRSSEENPELGVDSPTTRPERRSIPAVIAWAEAAVLKGIRGDMQAWSLVADRIEGKAGHRKDDVDPEEERRRGDIQQTIEAVVAGLVNARLSQPGDDSIDVTDVEAQPILDTERQDRDTARRQELAGAAQREAQDNQGRGESLAQTNQEPEERDLTDPIRGPQATRRTNGHG